MFNQKGIAFVPLLFWIAISVLGIAVVAEKTGHHLSLNNSPASEINSSNTDPLSQIAPSSSSSPAQDTEPLKVAPSNTPKVVKASDKALRLSTYIFAVSQGSQRSELINKFSNGKNDLALAVNSLALLLDSKPEALALVEKTVTQDLARRLSKNSEDSSNTSNTIFNDLEYSDPTPSLGTNTYGNSRPLTVTQVPLNQPNNSYPTYTLPSPTPTTAINVYGGADSYTRYGNTTYGSDGSSYTQYGNTVYGDDGSTYSKYGNTIYGNDGSTSTKYGNTTYESDGTSYSQYGNTIYGSDGSSYSKYGNTIYTQPGY